MVWDVAVLGLYLEQAGSLEAIMYQVPATSLARHLGICQSCIEAVQVQQE